VRFKFSTFLRSYSNEHVNYIQTSLKVNNLTNVILIRKILELTSYRYVYFYLHDRIRGKYILYRHCWHRRSLSTFPENGLAFHEAMSLQAWSSTNRSKMLQFCAVAGGIKSALWPLRGRWITHDSPL